MAQVDSPMPAPPPLTGGAKVEEQEELIMEEHSTAADAAGKDDDADSVIEETNIAESTAAAGGSSGGSMDAGDTVKVFLRLRPHPKEGSDTEFEFGRLNDDALVVVDGTSVQAVAPEDSQAYKNRETGGKFCFTKVFDKPTNQEKLFEETTANLVETFIGGKDGLLFAYGVTNAGKTYTVEGTDGNPGIIPRTLQLVFDKIAAKKADGGNVGDSIQVSYLQVYNEQVHDLQQEMSGASKVKERLKIKLRDDGVEVEGLRCSEIRTPQEGLDIVERGREARETHETQCNVQSSRSHSVFVISMERPDAGPDAKPARLYIVDLAGSERGKRTMASRVRQREASNINCSLMNLMRCLDTLRLNQRNKRLGKREKMVPFRESKLTLLFRDCFVGGNCGGVAMIINASARPADYDETAHALKYGALVKSVQVKRAAIKAPKRRSLYGFNGRRVGRTDSSDDVQTAASKGSKASGLRAGLNRKGSKGVLASKNSSGLRSAVKNTAGKKAKAGVAGSPLLTDQNEEVSDPTAYLDCSNDEYDSEFDDLPSEHHPVVSALLYELADARLKCISMESEVREEVAQEMASRLEEMESVFRQRVDAAKKISQRTSESLLDNLRKRMEAKGDHENDVYSMDAIVHEFEEEMQRMRELHSAEIKVLEHKVEELEKHENTATDVEKSAASKVNRKSFERLDDIVGSQLGMIDRLRDELEEERAMHEKTTQQLVSATMLSKDAQKGETELERRNAVLTQEIAQLHEQLRKARGGGGSFSSTATTSSAGGRESVGKFSPRIAGILGKKKSKPGPSKLNKHMSAPSNDEAWQALQQAGAISSHIRAESVDVLPLESMSTDSENSFRLANSGPSPELPTKFDGQSFKSTSSAGQGESFKSEGSTKRGLVSRMVGRIRR